MLIYHFENPRASKKYIKTRLPGHWGYNVKAQATSALFREWFGSCFVPKVKGYCKEKSLSKFYS
jgi:hypothetical protein